MAPRSPSPTRNSQSYETATYGNVDDGPHAVGEGDDAGSPLLGGPRKVLEDDTEREGTATLASGIGKLERDSHMRTPRCLLCCPRFRQPLEHNCRDWDAVIPHGTWCSQAAPL